MKKRRKYEPKRDNCCCSRQTANGDTQPCQPCKEDYVDGWCPRQAMVLVRKPHHQRAQGGTPYCLPCAEDAISKGVRVIVED